ncbi:MAG: ABC transporter permease [Nitrospirota bacterium]|nr:ABC transporter permease [Nitrospirota bacterium]
MKTRRQARFALRAVTASRLRSALMLLALAIGVAAVVVLTALGEGARRYVGGEFSALGTNLVIVLPGATETTGGPPPIMGVTPRDLTVQDAIALSHSRAVERVAPVAVGIAPVSRGSREREVMVLGTTHDMLSVRHLTMAAGRFLPPGDPERGDPVAVVGDTIRRELFAGKNPVGEWVRLGDRRFRVIGLLADTGRSMGTDLDQVVVIPVSQAQALFGTPGLFRVILQARGRDRVEMAKADAMRIIAERHEGEADVTVITQDAILATFDRIFTALTATVGGIAAISLIVAGILVMNVMLVAVAQRTPEVGLLKALGATPRRVRLLFLWEAALLSLAGAACGLALGYLGVAAIGQFYPGFPVAVPPWAAGAAVAVSGTAGLAFGVWPASRAARLDPVASLERR